MAHGQEEQVKGLELSLSGSEAVFERGNRLSIKSVAKLSQAQRIEVIVGVGHPLDDLLCQLQRSHRVALGGGAGEEMPGPAIELPRGVSRDLRRLLAVGVGVAPVVQGVETTGALFVQGGVVGEEPQQGGEVLDRLRVAPEALQGLAAGLQRSDHWCQFTLSIENRTDTDFLFKHRKSNGHRFPLFSENLTDPRDSEEGRDNSSPFHSPVSSLHEIKKYKPFTGLYPAGPPHPAGPPEPWA